MSKTIECDGDLNTLQLDMIRYLPLGTAALMLTASALALSIGGARADCTPPATGGPNIVTCTDAAPAVPDYFALDGDDQITITGGSLATPYDEIWGQGGDDTINLNGGFVNDIHGDFGGGGNDTINLNGGTVLLHVAGDSGDDTININGATVNGVAGFNGIEGGDGNDTFNMIAGTLNAGANINGEAGNDIINLTGGTIASDVLGGDDNDTITLDGTAVGGNIDGEAGDDTIDLLGGSVLNAIGGAGADTLTLDGATLSGNVTGGDDNDIINLLDGTALSAVGGAGNDTITLDGATLSVNIVGGDDDDTFNLLSGTTGAVNGDDGNDSITLNGATITGNLIGGLGDDTFNVLDGSFGGLLGGAGADTATFGPAFDLSTITGPLDGGADTDTLNLQSMGSLAAGSVLNWETVNVDGGNVTFTGGGGLTTGALNLINGGIADLDGGLAIIGDVTIGPGATLAAQSGAGAYSVSGVLVNDGTIDMSDGVGAGDVLTVGTYNGGGTLLMDVALDASLAGDQLVVNDFIGLDTTTIVLIDVAPGNPAVDTGIGPGNGIPLVDATGAGPLTSDFALAGGSVTKAPFTYNLVLETDDIFYLQTGVLSQVYAYSILNEVMRPDMPIMRDRLGDRRYGGYGTDGVSSMLAPTDNAGIWARIDGTKRDIDHSGGAESGEWDASRAEAEVGLDIPMELLGSISVFGISVHAIKGNADARSGLDPAADSSEVDTTGFGAGLGMSFFPGGGFYVDAQGRITAWDADVEATGIEQDVDAMSWGVSLEAGNRLMVAPNTSVIPRGRAVYSDVHFDSFTDSDGSAVSQEDSASLIIEAGVTVEQMFRDNGVSVFVDASVNHDVLSDSSVNVSTIEFESGLEDTWGQLQFGISAEVASGASAYVAADVGSPFDSNFGDSWSYGLEAGFRINF